MSAWRAESAQRCLQALVLAAALAGGSAQCADPPLWTASLSSGTGNGTHLDLSLFDCMTGVLANQAMNALSTGQAPSRLGNRHPNIVPYRTAATRDGHLIIAVGNDAQFQRLCRVLMADALAADERFTTNALRVQHRASLEPRLDTLIAARGRDELLAALQAAGVPAGPINTLDDVFADPHFQHRGMRIQRNGVDGLRTPLLFDGKPAVASEGAPTLAAHGRIGDLMP